MPIKFVCHHCGAVTDVAEQYAGQTGPCAECGQTVTLPLSPDFYGEPPVKPPRTAWVIAIWILAPLAICVGLLAAFLWPIVQAAREAAWHGACENNLKQIGLALWNYQEANHHLPPAYTVDKDGKPLHSWRVLILPYMEEQDLYKQFKLDEPWDSPTNLPLVDQMPSVYRCRWDSTAGKRDTSYAAISGPRTAFDGAKTISLKDLPNLNKTVLVVEAAGAGINWTEPRDLDVRQLDFTINDRLNKSPAIKSAHANGVYVLFADGHVNMLDNSTDPQALKAMCTIGASDTTNAP